MNDLIVQINKIKNYDDEITKIKNKYNNFISNNLKKIDDLINDDSISTIKKELTKYYDECLKIINKIIYLQKKIDLQGKMSLEFFIKKIDNFDYNLSNKNFVEDFVVAINNISDSVDKLTNGSKINIYDYNNSNIYMKIAKNYEIVYKIYHNLNNLINKNYIIIRDNEINNLKNANKNLNNELNTVTESLYNKLKENINVLEDLIKLNEKDFDKTIINDDFIEEEFKKDFKFLVATMRSNENAIKLKNYDYQRELSSLQPIEIDSIFIDESLNILIEADKLDNNVDELITNIMINFLKSYPIQFKKIITIQNQSECSLTPIMTKIYSCGSKREFALENDAPVFYKDESEINRIIKMLDDRVSKMYQLLGMSDEKDIFSYNANNSSIAEPLILVVIKDFPNGFIRNESFARFKNIYENGNRAGIFMIIQWSDSINNASREIIDYLKNTKSYLNIKKVNNNLLEKNHKISPLTLSNDFNKEKYFNNLTIKLKEVNNSFIDLFKIQDDIEFNESTRRTNFSKDLVIPIGKISGKVANITLSSDSKPHVIVNGGTGSGKTAFLHTLILSAALNYSPEELEINLFDFKDGVGFSAYKDIKLPHINFIALENKIHDASDVLKYLNSLMTYKNNLIKSIPGVSTIVGYNEQIMLGNYQDKPLIPRSLIIIDEYQFLLYNDKCIKMLDDIARKGRSVGMSLILVSQDVPTDSSFRKIKELLDHRFAFYNSSTNIDNLIYNYGKKANELDLQKGLCFYQIGDKSVVNTMRTAFAGDDKVLYDNIKRVALKFDCINKEMKIVGKPLPLIINDTSLVPNIEVNKLTNDYIERGICHIPLGKSNLSSEDVSYIADETNPLLVLVGDYIKAKCISVSIIHGMLRILNNIENNQGKLYFADLCETRLINVKTPINDLIFMKNKLEDECDETLSMISFHDSDSFEEMIKHLYNIHMLRITNKKANRDPIQVIILSIDTYDLSSSLSSCLNEMMENSNRTDIYFTIQVESFSKKFFTYNRSKISKLRDIIFLSNSIDNYDATNFNLCNELEYCNGIIPHNELKELRESFSNNTLSNNNCLYICEGNVIKYAQYQYQNNWADSLIKELKKGN